MRFARCVFAVSLTLSLALSLSMLLTPAPLAAQPRRSQQPALEIFWIDVEGGGATLIVAPNRESILVDTGFPGERDAQRIMQAAVTAGISRIDHLIITHYHVDHIGGVAPLSKLLTIRHFIDHGEVLTSDTGAVRSYDGYKAIAEKNRTIVKPGDYIDFGGSDPATGGIEVRVVSAGGKVLENRLDRGLSRSFCDGAETKPTDLTENSQSTGFLLTWGKFSFLDVGDLTWDREMELACPVNKIGEVSLFQATHHGFSNGQSGNPALIWSLHPQAVVVNNGGRKGFSDLGYETIAKIPGIATSGELASGQKVPGIWQLHLGETNDRANNAPDDQIANPASQDDKGYWIKATVAADGSFTITNSRNNFSQLYRPR